MADTAIDIVTTALEQIGVYGPGEGISAADTARALERLNTMLDVWSTESITCFAIRMTSFPLVVGQQKYTIGTGGDVNEARPIRIIEGPGAAFVYQTATNQRYGVNVVTRDKWNMIGSPLTNSNVPGVLFYDDQFPLGELNVYPVPNEGGYTMNFSSFQVLDQFADTGAAFSFPPGYKAAITNNLSVWCGPFWKTAVVSDDVKRLARLSKKAIQRANRRTPIAIFDSYIVSRPTATYDVYSDSMSREV